MADSLSFRTLLATLRYSCTPVVIGLTLMGGLVACSSSPDAAATASSVDTTSPTGPAPLNNQVSHDHFAAHAEPYLAVNPRNPRNLLGAAQVFQHPTSLPHAGIFASFDAGRTWPRQGPLTGPTDLPVVQDTTVAFNARGIGFVSALAMPLVKGRPGDVRSISVWRTDNGGRSFHRPVVLARGRLLDHPWLVADPEGKILYLVWDDLVRNTIIFSRTNTGGSSFAPGRTIYHGRWVGDPVIVAGPGGAVSVALYYSRNGRLFSMGVVNSLDQGRSFRTLRPVPQTPGDRLLYAGKGDPSSELGAALDPQTGMLSVVYAAYDRPGGRHTDVLLSRSPDGGRTWRSSVRVNDTPNGAETINQQPQVAVSRGDEVYVSYLSQRGLRMDLFLTESTSHGAAFRHSIRVTSRSFDPSLGIRTFRPGSWWIGDYQGLATGPSSVYPFWNDTRTGRLEIFTAIIPKALVRSSRAHGRKS